VKSIAGVVERRAGMGLRASRPWDLGCVRDGYAGLNMRIFGPLGIAELGVFESNMRHFPGYYWACILLR
jgi:hypothetical protein